MLAGISTASFYPMETAGGLVTTGVWKASCVEVFINTYSELNSQYTRELRKFADSYGTSIVSVHPFTSGFEPFLFFTEYEKRFKDALDVYRQYFEAMNILGASIFVFHGDRYASTFEDEKYYERFAILRNVGKEYGVIVAQENVERCKARSLSFLDNMATYLNGDLALVFDNKQALRSGISYSNFIDRLGKYIVHVHLSDSGKKGDCLPIGCGELDIKDLLFRLKIAGFNGAVVVELYNQLLESNEYIYSSYLVLCKLLREVL